jgi:hypothetical protein
MKRNSTLNAYMAASFQDKGKKRSTFSRCWWTDLEATWTLSSICNQEEFGECVAHV